MHFLHLSTARSVALVAAARREGLPVTCEVAPHHFTLDEGAARATTRVQGAPAAAHAGDVAALRAALATGDVDAVATDHAPHAPELKDLPFDEAPAGMLGLEHAASLTFEALGADADPRCVLRVLSRGPARIAQLRGGRRPASQRPRR